MRVVLDILITVCGFVAMLYLPILVTPFVVGFLVALILLTALISWFIQPRK